LKAEAEAFKKLVGEVEKLSGDVLRQHGKAAAARS